MGAAVELDQHSITTTAGPLSCPSTPPPVEKSETSDIATEAVHNFTMRRAPTAYLPFDELHKGLDVNEIVNMEGNTPEIITELVDIPDQDNPGMKRQRRILRSKGGPDSKPYLPGQPRVLLEEASKSNSGKDLKKYLDKSHLTDETDGVLKWMKYIFVSS